MNRLKVGIVGCGSWAQETHLPYLLSQRDVELVGIVDTAVTRRAELTRKYTPRLPVKSVSELLDRGPINALIVSTPHATHFDIARAVLTKGVHVHVDKPLCSTVAQIDELIRCAAEARLVLSTHTQRKYMPGQSWLKWCLRTHFSEVYHVSGSLWQPVFNDYPGSWRADNSLAAGGILMDSGYHVVDTILSILAPRTTAQLYDVAALAHKANKPNDAFTTLVFRVASTVVQVNAFRGTPRVLKKEEYQVLGDAGHVGLLYTGGGVRKTCQTLFMSTDGRRHESEDLPITSSYNFHPLHLFLQAVRGDVDSRELVCENVEIARMTIHILEQAYHLGPTGR